MTAFACYHCGSTWPTAVARRSHESNHRGARIPDDVRRRRASESAARYRIANRQRTRDASKRWRRTPGAADIRRAQRQRQIRDGKHTARMRVHRALESGLLTRQPCQECGAAPAEAHHYLGYEREHWLDVQWLCDLHHARVHHPDAIQTGSVVELVT